MEKKGHLMQIDTRSHLLLSSEGQVVLHVPQKLGLLFRFTQNKPLFVWHVVGDEGSQSTVHCPAASSTPHLATAGLRAEVKMSINAFHAG